MDTLADPSLNTDLDIQVINYDPLSGRPNSQRAADLALSEGLQVVYPEPDELQIDIDNEHSFTLYQKQLDIVKKYVGVESEKIAESRSGYPKRHITLKLTTPVNMVERIALQACLGSDRVREILAYVQYKDNDPNPILFLEKV